MQAIEVKPEYYTLIFNGEKKVILSINNKKYKVKESIRIVNDVTKQEFVTNIKDINFYPSIEKLFIREGLKNIFPDVWSFEEALEKYQPFDREIQEFGVIAIQV